MQRRTFLAAPLSTQFDITKFGASPEASERNRPAIQRAIDECAAGGGGFVRVPAGRFVTGTLRLKSGVALWLDHGAVLAGSPDPRQYESRRPTDRVPPDGWASALILGEDVEQVALLGHGSITGAGLEKPRISGRPRESFRPRLISFERSREVRVEGLTLRDPDRWCLHFYDCDAVQARGLRIRARYDHYNTDGIDVDGSRNVVISDCDIIAGDDCIVLKTTTYLGFPRPCENVTVTNCTLSTRASALKIGTETHGPFSNITFSNCTVYGEGAFRPDAIAIEAVDGGFLRGVAVSNVAMRHTRAPLFVRLGARAAPSRLEDVVVSGIVAVDAGETSSITGVPGHEVRNVALRGLRVDVTGGGDASLIGREPPEREAAYPKSDMFGPLPAFGLFIRHARGIDLSDLRFTSAQPDARPVLVANDVVDLSIDSLASPAPSRLHDVTGAWVNRTNGAVQISGKQSEHIVIRRNPFAPSAKSHETSADVPDGAVRVID